MKRKPNNHDLGFSKKSKAKGCIFSHDNTAQLLLTSGHNQHDKCFITQGWASKMTKVFGQCVIAGLLFSTLSACQWVDSARIKQVEYAESPSSNALIYCSGTHNCEFERLGDIFIVDALTHRVNSEAIDKGLVRLQAKTLNQPNALYLSAPAKQQELVIRFYPISPDRAETLHVIHAFKAKQSYTFKMYRDRTRQHISLLNASAPDPLCVDLQQEQKTIRRFCRPYDPQTGLGEFVEQKI